MPRSPWGQKAGLSPWSGAVALAAGVGALALASGLVPPTTIAGPAEVVDGDTLRIRSERVRLVGLDAPELSQTCTDADNVSWACGRQARSFVVSLVSGRTVTCSGSRRDTYGRALAKCDSGSGDLGSQIVAAGWAVSDVGYLDEANAARAAKRGIWSGSFVSPAQWRRGESGTWLDPWGWITSWFHS